MKTTRIKVVAGIILLVFFAMSSFAQATKKTTKNGDKKVTKIEKSKVPKEVTEPYYIEYPVSTYDYWYGYPKYDYGTDWFDDWYDYGPFAYTEYPEFYVIESVKDKTPHKAVYTKSGKKIAIHKILKTDLPKAVSASISKGEYKSWKLGKDKEEIFKDSDKDKLKVYKVNVEKGKEKHTLFFQSDGKLLKDKKVS